ncbi:hypothetical protein GALMADRAFT_236744 [Galerina marginata CBS 339.88]|uniref:Uncharacterized protein n=1 Tax=Galerina marginata (strain CBS 339.88) TaxID=685588 RepID=A0A067TLJ4_GALM3|nr:hypothetical protein GALMADRAFT_236744 [Galerina marginata CBS 339.88]
MPRSTRYKRIVRCPEPPSPSSTDATFGSDTESSSDCEEDIKDVDEVAEFLLQPDPEPETYSTKIEPPFSLCSVPGPLLLQLLHFLLLYLNLVPSHTLYPTPAPKRPPPRRPALPVKFGNRNDLWYYPDLKRVGWGVGPSMHEEDDTEYVVPPTPGTDESPIRITVTRNWSEAKIKTHNKNMLRIYRVPHNERRYFRIIVLKHDLLGYPMRRPVDEDDAVAVFRHENRSWDLGLKDETWMLLGTDHHLIWDIARRCEYRKPPFVRRVTKFIWRSAVKVVSPLIPWA